MNNTVPPKGNAVYHVNVSLQNEVRSLRRRLEKLESENGVAQIEENYRQKLASRDRTIAALKKQLADLKTGHEKQLIREERIWKKKKDEEIEELEQEYERTLRETKCQRDAAYREAGRADAETAKEREQRRVVEQELKKTRGTLENVQQKVAALTRQLRQNHTNSGIPSSKDPLRARKKVQNSRVKSGRKPGGQQGHAPHFRYSPEPTAVVVFEERDEITASEDWVPTGMCKVKKLVDWNDMGLVVTAYECVEYKNLRTGKKHTPHPEGMPYEVNYGSGVKAMILSLVHRGNMSIRKAQEHLYDITGGRLRVSTGFIAGLEEEFKRKSETEITEIFARLATAPYMHIDSTTAKNNGKHHCVTVNASADAVYYHYTKTKGHAAVRDTPAEVYTGTLIQDRESTFLNYGKDHQLCTAHLDRDCKDVIENEKDRKWPVLMLDLLQDTVGKSKTWDPDNGGAPNGVRSAISRKYNAIIRLGKKEYAEKPPEKHFTRGCTMLRVFEKMKDSILYFVTHPGIPATNNMAERLLREFKRAQASKITWRAPESLTAFCHVKSVLETVALQNGDRYAKMREVFAR